MNVFFCFTDSAKAKIGNPSLVRSNGVICFCFSPLPPFLFVCVDMSRDFGFGKILIDATPSQSKINIKRFMQGNEPSQN